ncbi:hypothetical protein LCGC14_1345190 [marine sediment metagenome]|uniref:Uncharacterized protein n=1 Tax=marine sediment metagenome TaxID=412755 RepID=A0A0F9KD88_9ZZZZ
MRTLLEISVARKQANPDVTQKLAHKIINKALKNHPEVKSFDIEQDGYGAHRTRRLSKD